MLKMPAAEAWACHLAENRQIYGFFTFFWNTRSKKNTVNTNVLGGSEAPNHGIYDVFCLWYKNHSICKFFGQCLAKTLVFTRHCTLQYFGSALRVRGGGTEMTSNLLNNQVMGLASLRKAKLKVPPLELPVVISSWNQCWLNSVRNVTSHDTQGRPSSVAF
jgi:hypothetical protein